MAYRNAFPINLIRGGGAAKLWREMGDDLVAVEVEIDPFSTGAALGAAKQAAIEAAGGVEIMDGESKMKGRHGAETRANMRARQTDLCGGTARRVSVQLHGTETVQGQSIFGQGKSAAEYFRPHPRCAV